MFIALSVSINMARYALIIGIAEYTGSFKSLETPVKNANAIADILDQYGDFNQVKRLPFRREAGQKDLGKIIRKPLLNGDLVRELQQFLQDANGSDVLIYYSGHGFTKLDQLSQTAEGYLAPSDCQVEQNAARQIIAEKNGISLFSLNTLINRHNFNSLVVILDCCNAGAFLESGMVRRDVTAFDYQRDYYLITACRNSSKAYEGEEYSLLTDALLKGLSPTNAAPGSGRISGDRLFDVIGNELHNSRQEPIRMGWGRLITLVRYLQQQEDSESTSYPFNPANPYMGLKPFEREQADYFFGREQATRAMLDRLKENRFLAVIGPSGCGKSSLVRAGLLPELEGDRIPGSRDWQVEIITPGQYPLQALINILEQHRSSNQSVVLFVDQFEELFALCPNEEEQRSFIQRLNEEINSSEWRTRIIIAMRGDFLDRCAKFHESADLINSTAPTTYMVIPLTEVRLVAELEDSITRPALLHGVGFESGLVSRIVDDVVNQLGAMPLLQYALAQLWDNCISPHSVSRSLTIQGYDAIGGVKGALQRWADQFYTNLSPDDQAFVKDLISELVQIGDGNEVTRRRASWGRLREIASSQKQLNDIIGRLIYQRLLVADDKTVEVAHEALLSESRLIRSWVEENRESIRLQQRLETYCQEWQEHDRSENYLLDAGRLAAIDDWIGKKQPRLMSVDQEFIRQSRERRDRQFQAQLEQERRLREEAEGRAIAEIEKKIEAEEREKEALGRAKAEKRGKRLAIVAGMLGAFILGLGLLVQLRQSEVKQQQSLTVGAIIGRAEQLLETHSELEALEASIEALGEVRKTDQENSFELQRIQKVISNVRELDRIEAHEGGTYALSFSPNGERIVSGGADGSIRIWDLRRNHISPLIRKHSDLIRMIRFSPNGNLFASASLDGTIKIWNNQGNVIDTFNYGSTVYDISFSENSRQIAATGINRGVVIWDIKSREIVQSIDIGKYAEERKPNVYSLDINSINKSILATTGFEEYDIIFWDLSQKTLSPRYIGKTQFETTSIRFNFEGDIVASCDDRGNVKIRNLSGELIGEVPGTGIPCFYVQFSQDNKLIATAGSGKTIKIWKVDEILSQTRMSIKAAIEPYKTIEVNSGTVRRISFHSIKLDPQSAEEVILASADEGGSIRLWRITESEATNEGITSSDLLEKACKSIKNYLKRQKSKVLSATLTECVNGDI